MQACSVGGYSEAKKKSVFVKTFQKTGVSLAKKYRTRWKSRWKCRVENFSQIQWNYALIPKIDFEFLRLNLVYMVPIILIDSLSMVANVKTISQIHFLERNN